MKTISLFLSIAGNLIWLLGFMLFSCSESNFKIDCTIEENRCLEISGRLSKTHVQALEAVAGEIDFIQINSKGGPVGSAAKLANLIMLNELDLHIYKYCSSACAEFLMPAAKEIFAYNFPVVGVHGNPLVDAELYYRQSGKSLDSCPWQAKKTLEAIYREKGLKPSFTNEQIERLGVLSFTYEGPGSGHCISGIELETMNWQWQPTRGQFEETWGVIINGDLCADSDSCWQAWAVRSDKRTREPRTCAFGDAIRPC